VPQSYDRPSGLDLDSPQDRITILVIIQIPVRMMKTILFTGMFALVLAEAMPGFGEESLLFDTWAQSYFHPDRLDEFIQAHKAQYTDDYFGCSQEAQRLIGEEADVRDRRCDFSPGSGVRGQCRKENFFRGLDTHLAELDQAIRNRTAWLDLESGRQAATAAKAAEDLEKSCTPPTCDIAKRKKNEMMRGLKPYLQCPPLPDRPSDVDPSFKTFELPSDPGG
jgi:hypothetical protein